MVLGPPPPARCTFSLGVPPELVQRLDAYATSRQHRSRRAAIVELLEAALAARGFGPSDPRPNLLALNLNPALIPTGSADAVLMLPGALPLPSPPAGAAESPPPALPPIPTLPT